MRLPLSVSLALPLSLLVLCGCPPKPPIVAPIPTTEAQDMSQPDNTAPAVPACSTAAQLKQEDICDGFFTKNGLACARCSNVKGCVDSVLVMYCATGPCAYDPVCSYAADPLMKSSRKQ